MMNNTNHLFSLTLIGVTFLILGFTLLADEEGIKFFFLFSGVVLLVYASYVQYRSGKSSS